MLYGIYRVRLYYAYLSSSAIHRSLFSPPSGYNKSVRADVREAHHRHRAGMWPERADGHCTMFNASNYAADPACFTLLGNLGATYSISAKTRCGFGPQSLVTSPPPPPPPPSTFAVRYF